MAESTEKPGFRPRPLLWQAACGVAVVAGTLTLILSVLLIADYLRFRSLDPLNDPHLQTLRKQLAATPAENPAVVEEIRTLDLFARRSYFSNVGQRRLGGMLLIGVAAVLLISLKLAGQWRPKLPETEAKGETENPWQLNVQMRRMLAGGGVALLAVALALAFAPARNLETLLRQTALPPAKPNPPATIPDKPGPVAPEPPKNAVGSAEAYAKEMSLNWPSLRGPNGCATAHFTTVPASWNLASGEGVLWKTPIPAPGFNSPIAWGGKLFLSGANAEGKRVFCLDADTGKMLWEKTLAAFPGSPAERPDVSDDTGLAASSMATDGQRVFAIFATGDLACYDFAGTLVWGRNIGIPKTAYGHASSLISDGVRLFVQYDHSESACLMALDVATGKELWLVKRDGASWASPLLAATPFGLQLVVNSLPNVTAYDPATGKQLWQVECLGGEVAPSPAYANGKIFVANEYAKAALLKLSATKAEIAWEYEETLPDIASPLLTEKYAFMTTSGGDVACLDVANGKPLWKHDFGTGFNASPILVGDRVYAIDVKGNVQIFAAKPEFQLIATIPMGEKTFATPIIGDGRLYIRTVSAVYGIGTKIKK
jgi:outer membrane protein assembly factor BamB